MRRMRIVFFGIVAVTLITGYIHLQTASAHCDTMDGPVVATAQKALQTGDVTPVLKWVKSDHEAEIRQAFQNAVAVRSMGPKAKQLADTYFFETLVRIHRAGEGAPYNGLQPAGSIEPIIAASDKALETQSVDEVIKHVTDAAGSGIRQRFNRVSETKKHANDNVQAGREYVESYVKYTHYVERLYNDAVGQVTAHVEPATHAVEEHQHP